MSKKNIVYSVVALILIVGGYWYYSSQEQTTNEIKTINIANGGEPASLDPHFVSGTWENWIVGNMFYGLMYEDIQAEAILGAAESYKISDDGLVYTFTIRDHNWSDGVPVTAEDFVYSLQRILQPETGAEYAYLLYTIKGAEEYNTGKAPVSELAVKALDAKTLEITLAYPAPFFLTQLTHYTAYPVPKHLVEKFGIKWTSQENIAVNGPYTVEGRVPNETVTLMKNEGFFDADKVAIDRVVFHTLEDSNANLKRFRANELDLMTGYPLEQNEWLQENMPETVYIAPYLGIYYYTLHVKDPLLEDVRVRTALSLAVNRDDIVNKVTKEGQIAAYSFVPAGVANYETPGYYDWKDLPYSEQLAKAKALMAEAGYSKDNPLKLTVAFNTSEAHKAIALAIADQWKAINVNVELFNQEVRIHYQSLKNADYQVGRAGWIGDYNDAQNFLSLLETRTGPNNYSRYSNPVFDQLMVDASIETDLKKRSDIMRKAEEIMLADTPIIPIYYYVSKNLVHPYVSGFETNAQDIHRLIYMDIDKPEAN